MGVVNFLCMWFQVESEAFICASVSVQTPNGFLDAYIIFSYFGLGFLHLILAIFFNMKLKQIIEDRKKREKDSNQLVPWCVTSTNSEDVNIPQRAMYVSTSAMIFSAVGTAFYGISFTGTNVVSNANLLFSSFLICSITLMVYLPLVLLFTVQHNRTIELRKLFAQPPSELQFHNIATIPNDDESEFHADKDSYEGVECNVDTQNQIAVFTTRPQVKPTITIPTY